MCGLKGFRWTILLSKSSPTVYPPSAVQTHDCEGLVFGHKTLAAKNICIRRSTRKIKRERDQRGCYRAVVRFFCRELHDIYLRIGAQEKTRTSTTIQSLAPEASASTNSATWAYTTIYYFTAFQPLQLVHRRRLELPRPIGH